MKLKVIFVLFVLFVILLYMLITYSNNNAIDIKLSKEIIEVEIEEDTNEILNVEKIKFNGENVFFVETHNTTEHKLSTRQACSIESAAFMNPNATIYVVLHTPSNYANLEETQNVQILREYPNIKFKYVNIKEFSKNTPLESWISSGALSNSNYVVSHTSDVLRYLLLYRFPGLYLDTDVFAVSPYGQIKLDNFACAESDEYLNGAVLRLSGSSGRKFAENFLIKIAKNFNATVWSSIGPHLLTRVIKDLCKVSTFSSIRTKKCENFHILPPSKCYAIGWEEWEKFFQTYQADYVRRHTEDSFFVHLWNKFSDSRKIFKDEATGINEIVSKFCPKIYQMADFL